MDQPSALAQASASALFAGLTAFDDAINSDRKVWTSRDRGRAAGGTLAYLISRARRTLLAGRDRR
jgi:hypothetical protein